MSNITAGEIGIIKREIINALNLPVTPETPIYIGKTNINHMRIKHPDTFIKYNEYIPMILDNPDYIGINPKDGSIEYVKEFLSGNEYVKVAVRVSTKNKYFARSLYVLNKTRVENFINKGTLKQLTKSKE
ncbi:MAG: PBECR2 nuclease fold domain-containing protein [Oscillospiraceae bacterium]|nr:PBECR2 nuclease fold domain-containing protein [Oscillospiraceae bacterium]